MKDMGGPVKSFPLAEEALRQFQTATVPDFSDTEKTFRHLSDDELRRTAWLFRLMGKEWLTNIMSLIGLPAVHYKLPFAAWTVKKTVFAQFVGGESLPDSQQTIKALYERKVTSILDYGSEAKNTREAFDNLVKEVTAAIEFSQANDASIAAVVKITGLADDKTLERHNKHVPSLNGDLSAHPDLQDTLDRLDKICKLAAEKEIQIYLDAEESWMQNTIDALADEMMLRYNKERVVVLNTYQLYRHDRLAFLKASHQRAVTMGYHLGAKLVRGAYMVKENARALDAGYGTPIQPSLEATHQAYNDAVRYCIEHHETIGTCIGTHNEKSTKLACQIMQEKGMKPGNKRVQFAQLCGMSDNLTYNLAEAGFNVSKYLVYGPVAEVLPYLVRRAQENTSVTGEMGRELRMIHDELERRGV